MIFKVKVGVLDMDGVWLIFLLLYLQRASCGFDCGAFPYCNNELVGSYTAVTFFSLFLLKKQQTQ